MRSSRVAALIPWSGRPRECGFSKGATCASTFAAVSRTHSAPPSRSLLFGPLGSASPAAIPSARASAGTKGVTASGWLPTRMPSLTMVARANHRRYKWTKTLPDYQDISEKPFLLRENNSCFVLYVILGKHTDHNIDFYAGDLCGFPLRPGPIPLLHQGPAQKRRAHGGSEFCSTAARRAGPSRRPAQGGRRAAPDRSGR